MFPHASSAIVEAFLQNQNILAKAGILDAPYRLAYCFANLAHETAIGPSGISPRTSTTLINASMKFGQIGTPQLLMPNGPLVQLLAGPYRH